MPALLSGLCRTYDLIWEEPHMVGTKDETLQRMAQWVGGHLGPEEEL